MNLSALLRNQVARPLLGKGRFNLQFQEAPGVIRAVQTLEPLHYSDGGDFLDIDTAWQQEDDHAAVHDAAFDAVAAFDLQAPEVLRIASEGLELGFKPLPLYYASPASDLLLPNTMQRLVRPQAVSASLAGDKLLWDGAYGDGTLLEWRATPTGVQKWLTVDRPERLPVPKFENASLVFGFALTMPGLRAALKSGLIDLTRLETAEAFTRLLDADGTPIFALQRPVATDAAGESVQGALSFRRFGPALVLAAKFPHAWLSDPDRVYPLRIDPTVTTEQTDLANDGWVNASSLNSATLYVGTRTTADRDYRSYIRWPDSPVPKGATIVSDVLKLNQAGANGSVGPDILITYEAVDNATPIIDRPDFLARPRTPVAATWTPGASLELKTTPNLKSGLQAVVNRPGYVIGSAVQTFMRDTVDNNSVINRIRFNSSEDGSTVGPKRETVYTEPASPGSAVTVLLRSRDSNDDGYSYSPDGFNRGSYGVVGDIDSTHYDYRTFVRCTLDPGKQLPQGVTLIKAEVVMRAYGGAATGTDVFGLSLQPSDNPSAPANKAAHDAPRGTKVSFNPGGWGGSTEAEYTVDITAIAQSIVNRPGYNSGAMLLFIDGAGGGYGGQNNNAQLYLYDTDPAKAVFIRIVYGDPSPPILTSTVIPR